MKRPDAFEAFFASICVATVAVTCIGTARTIGEWRRSRDASALDAGANAWGGDLTGAPPTNQRGGFLLLTRDASDEATSYYADGDGGSVEIKPTETFEATWAVGDLFVRSRAGLDWDLRRCKYTPPDREGIEGLRCPARDGGMP